MLFTQFQTERLIVRPTSVEDAAFILELLNTPQWIHNIGDRNVRTLEDAEDYITTKMLSQLEKLGYSNNTVIRKEDGVKIGTCGLYKRDGLENVDIGFAFLPEYQKLGYAFESSNKLKEIALEKLDMDVINAITIKENEPSQNLLKKLGFHFVKIMRLPNDDEDLMLFELKREI